MLWRITFVAACQRSIRNFAHYLAKLRGHLLGKIRLLGFCLYCYALCVVFIQYNFSGSNTDISFTTAVSNSFLSL